MKTVIYHIFLALGFLLINQAEATAQVDQHIDPSSDIHKHSLTFTRHVNSSFSTTKANNAFDYVNEILQKCDNSSAPDQDVACQVQFELSGSISTFNTSGLDIITTLAERQAAISISGAYVKVVSSIMVKSDGTPGTVLGFAQNPGSSMVIVNGQSDNRTGFILIHEFGHNKGLPHRIAPGSPIMVPAIDISHKEVNLTEAAAYHQGGAVVGPYRPVDVGFVIDDTGSMSEEIEGVKQAILRTLSTYTANSCETVFQLVTFKDNVSSRNPTTDLSVIQSQVNALSASGGGDCPEASVEAIIAISNNVKDKGTIFVATDAAPHAGVDLDATTNALKARNVTVSTILSGDCSSVTDLTASSSTELISNGNSNVDPVPYSDNGLSSLEFIDPSGESSALAAASFTAIEAFSFLARETGGTFAFIPEVNSSNPLDKQLYENTAFNIIQGAINKSVAFIQPAKGPRGSTMAVKFTGSNTHFNSSTSLSFDPNDISISDLQVISPTELIAVLAIDAGASLDFKDIITSTLLPGGDTETAIGEGAFLVTIPPLNPTILSVAPPSGIQGENFTVRVYGSNSNFDSSSELTMGSGITILSTTAVSPGILEANIQIAPDATAGFRSIVVTTGSEIVDENVIGPFFVSLSTVSPCDLTVDAGEDAEVYLDVPDHDCVTLIATGPEVDAPGTSILWSTGETTSSIVVCPETTTDYTVLLTGIDGCIAEDVVTVCVKDISCGNGPNLKVEICHNSSTLCVSINSVAAHLNHGDQLGSCDEIVSCVESFGGGAIPLFSLNDNTSLSGEIDLSIFPNPAKVNLTFKARVPESDGAKVIIYDLNGKELVKVWEKQSKDKINEFVIPFKSSVLSTGVYIVRLETSSGYSQTKKLILLDR